MIKKYLIAFIISLVLSVGAASLRGGYVALFGLDGIYLCSLVGAILFSIVTLLFLKKNGNNSNPLLIMLAVLVGASILDVPSRLLEYYFRYLC